MAWDLLVDRSDLAHTRLAERPVPALAEGEVLLRTDRVGVTANNVTYAVMGDAMKYWDFFPVPEDGWGRVPLWGFAEVEASTVPEVTVGTRVYGYLPTSSHLVVQPTKLTSSGFRDGSAHRQHLPTPYNGLTYVDTDPAYDAAREDLQVLYRPLFMTSFMLADFLQDNEFFGAEAAVFSSASSKTAYGTAHLLKGKVDVLGLTSEPNRDFTSGLGCYDQVLGYEQAGDLPAVPTVYVDVAGNRALRRTVHEGLGDHLLHSAVVGAAHHTATEDAGSPPGVRPQFFFAPDQMRKRYADWGPSGVEEGHAEAWRAFVPVVQGWVDVVVGSGPEALREDWLEVLAGTTPPRVGHVVQL
jgi:hypothetical protein